jgi:hypothetical protein
MKKFLAVAALMMMSLWATVAHAAISNVYVTQRTTSSITLTWSSDNLDTNDSVAYDSQTAGVCGTPVNATSTTSCSYGHTYTLTGLLPNTSYCIRPFGTICTIGGTDTGTLLVARTLYATPTATPTFSVSPTNTPTATITATFTNSPTRTASPTPTSTKTNTPTFTASPTSTFTASPTSTPTTVPTPLAGHFAHEVLPFSDTSPDGSGYTTVQLSHWPIAFTSNWVVGYNGSKYTYLCGSNNPWVPYGSSASTYGQLSYTTGSVVKVYTPASRGLTNLYLDTQYTW